MVDSPLTDIYQKLRDLITTIPATTLWFDLDIGQLDDDDVDLPMKYPAVLVRFDDVTWKALNALVQIGVVCVSVKFVYQFKSESQIINNSVSRQEVKDCLNTLFVIHNQIAGATNGTSFSRLTRFNQYHVRTKPNSMLWIHVLQYQTNIQSDNNIANPNALNIDYVDILNNNNFMDRKRQDLIHK